MQKWLFGLVVGAFLAAPWGNVAQAEGLRCNGRLVDVGDNQATVRQLCGAPAGRSAYEEEVREQTGAEREVRTAVQYEQWVFDFGPDRLQQVVAFRNGQVFSIASGGYGMAGAAGNDACRGGQLLQVGQTLAEVELRCGPPATQSRRYDTLVETLAAKTEIRRRITIDEWWYDFGPERLALKLHFENARLVTIESGARGN